MEDLNIIFGKIKRGDATLREVCRFLEELNQKLESANSTLEKIIVDTEHE